MSKDIFRGGNMGFHGTEKVLFQNDISRLLALHRGAPASLKLARHVSSHQDKKLHGDCPACKKLSEEK